VEANDTQTVVIYRTLFEKDVGSERVWEMLYPSVCASTKFGPNSETTKRILMKFGIEY